MPRVYVDHADMPDSTIFRVQFANQSLLYTARWKENGFILSATPPDAARTRVVEQELFSARFDEHPAYKTAPTLTVWVARYDHRHGTATVACATEEIAQDWVFDAMEHYMDEFAGNRPTGAAEAEEMRKLIADRDFGLAVQKWAERTGEMFDVEDHRVLT